MKLSKKENGYYEHYQKQSLESSIAEGSFNYANDYANYVEDLLEKGVEFEKAFENAYKNVDDSALNGSQKNAAYTILTKVWEYGAELEEYNVNLYDKSEGLNK